MKVAQSCLTLCNHWNSPGQEYWIGYHFSSPGNLPNPEIEPMSPALQVGSLPAEPQMKAKNTGVGSLFLLQWIFLTQELNQGLLHCRCIFFFLPTEPSGELNYILLSYKKIKNEKKQSVPHQHQPIKLEFLNGSQAHLLLLLWQILFICLFGCVGS